MFGIRLVFVVAIGFVILHGSLEFGDLSKIQVKVGALFFNDEHEVELSFDEAFNEINNLPFFQVHFVSIKRYVPVDDSFMLQQMTCELMSNGVAAIFGPSSKASTDIVAVIANAAGIPHMQYDWSMMEGVQMEQNHGMSVNVAPLPSVVSKAYYDIIKKNYDWKSFTIAYETDEGLARLQNLMDIEDIDRDLIKLRRIGNYKQDYRVLWKEAAETLHEQRLILDCEPETLVPLLNSAVEFGLMGPFKNWFLSHLNTHSSGLRHIYNERFMANITGVRLKVISSNPYERKKTRISRVDEILGNQTMLPILIYDAVVLFANAARKIIAPLREYEEPFQSCENGRIVSRPWYEGRLIVKEMKNMSDDDVEPGFKTENLQLNELGQRTHFHLEIFKPTVNEPMAMWKTDRTISPISMRPEYSASNSPTPDFSLTKKMYTVVTHFEMPYFMLKLDYENFRGDDKYEGYAVDLIKKLSEILDFDYRFMIVDSNGKYNPATKQWDGVIGKLIEHQAQIGICDITITQSRRKVVDFTVPFMQLGISILYYKIPPKAENLFAFLEPFASEVWSYMLITQLFMTMLFMLMARISYVEWGSPNPLIKDPVEVENVWAKSNSFWLMIGSIMQQSCDILPRGPPMRILNAMWYFFALMMLSTYTANLAAFLTNNKMQNTIKNLDDLVNQDTINFGTVRGGSTSLFFSESNETLYSKAWNQFKAFTPSAFTANNKEGVERVIKDQGNYAFLMETTSLSYNMEQRCDLVQVGEQIGEKHYGLAVPLGSDYRLNLSVSILQLSEKGELYKMKNKWWKNASIHCEEQQAASGDELSIIELGGVFLLLCGGVLIAAIIGICEFLWNVERVAAEEMVTVGEAFKAELLFVFKFWVKQKPIRIASSSQKSSSVEASRSSRSRNRIGTRSRSKNRAISETNSGNGTAASGGGGGGSARGKSKTSR